MGFGQLDARAGAAMGPQGAGARGRRLARARAAPDDRRFGLTAGEGDQAVGRALNARIVRSRAIHAHGEPTPGVCGACKRPAIGMSANPVTWLERARGQSLVRNRSARRWEFQSKWWRPLAKLKKFLPSWWLMMMRTHPNLHGLAKRWLRISVLNGCRHRGRDLSVDDGRLTRMVCQWFATSSTRH